MTDESKEPLHKRKSQMVDPRLVGARWWQEQLAQPLNESSRRSLLTWALGGAGVLLVGGPILAALTRSKAELKTADALAAQRAHGWSLGSEGEVVEFASATGGPFPLERLKSLAADLAPVQPRLAPYYVPTLFQSTTGAPPQPTGSRERQLADILRPLASPEMAAAQGRGEALATLFNGAPAGKAVIINLPGPEAVAFAAGLSSVVEPVFLFDNWPHPRGVVPSHLTLAAAASLTPTLQAGAAQRRSGAAPAFVLDRARLTPYVDDSGQFDNRYLAKLPTGQALKAMGIGEVLYVAPAADSKESDDLVDDFIGFAEECGLIIPIRKWVMRTACQQIIAWQEKFGAAPVISVNAAIRELESAHFAVDTLRIIAEAGVAPDNISIEVELITQHDDKGTQLSHAQPSYGGRRRSSTLRRPSFLPSCVAKSWSDRRPHKTCLEATPCCHGALLRCLVPRKVLVRTQRA